MPRTRLTSKIVFLALVVILAASAGVAGQMKYNEAPELAELVKAGKLPPVEERLPENPMVLEPIEKIGKYGGDLRTALVGGHVVNVARFQGYENLVRWTPNWDGIMPNVAESWEVNEESTEFTFFLRKGMKWSDGHPFTADDVMFWYEDVFMNPEITPVQAAPWVHGGKPVVVEKIDDYTVKFKFDTPNGLFLLQMADVNFGNPVAFPKHYLSQFHEDYNPDVDKLARDEGFSNWVELFEAKGGIFGEPWYRTTGCPTIHAWYFTLAPGQGDASRAIAVRNPYYWKVDPAGNQLPYIDRIVYEMPSDVEVLLLQVLSGQMDMIDQYFATPANKPVVYDNQERGGYRMFTTTSTMPNDAVIMLNMTHPDPVKREIFQNKKFRIGLSHAIDREEIIDLVYVGQGEPHQVAPRPESDLYNERMAKQYTEYDVDLANQYLDEAGFTQRDREGYRLGPDGKRITIVFEIDAARPMFIDIAELLRGYWQQVGIDVQVRTMDRSLWEVRVRENAEHDATIHKFGGGTGAVVYLDPRYWLPMDGNAFYARAWQVWRAMRDNPDMPTAIEPQEPPEEVKRQNELYDKLLVTGDPAEQKVIMEEILDLAADVFYHIGITTEPDNYGIANKRLRNVPDTMPWSWIYPHPAPTNPQLYFYE